MLLSELTSFIDANRHKGRREAFGFKGFELKTYLLWAFSFDYLFVVSDKNGIIGAGIAYPLSKPYDGNQETLFSFANPVKKSDENQHELCIMDWLAVSKQGRIGLVNKFKKRFPHWDSVTKLGIQNDNVCVLPNKYINLLNTI